MEFAKYTRSMTVALTSVTYLGYIIGEAEDDIDKFSRTEMPLLEAA